MKTAVTDRAWRGKEQYQVLPMLQEQGVEGVAVSFSMLEREVSRVCQSVFTRARARRKAWAPFGLRPVVLEQVLDVRFGDWNSPRGWEPVFDRLQRALDVAVELEVSCVNVTSASIATRGVAPEHMMSLRDEWACVSDRALREGVHLFCEPVPRLYGARIMRDTEETCEFWDHLEADVGVGLDTTALSFEKNMRSALAMWSGQASLFSVSEPGLAPLKSHGPVPHRRFAQELSRLSKSDRCPQWLVLRLSRAMTSPVAHVQENVERLRSLYALPLRETAFERI
jgi:hypothetical protein